MTFLCTFSHYPNAQVQRATLEALPTLVRNADFGRQTALFNPSFSLPQSLDGNYGGVGEANSNNNNNNKIPIVNYEYICINVFQINIY
jgi:hypothetical protein